MGAEHWRDPMQALFLGAAVFARGATTLMRVAGVVFVCFGMGLIFVVGGIFAYAIVPVVSETHVQWTLHAVTTMVLLFNIYFNYALCVATDPGYVKRGHAEPVRPELSEDSDSSDGDAVDEEDDEQPATSDGDALIQRRGHAVTTSAPPLESISPVLPSLSVTIEDPPLIQIIPGAIHGITRPPPGLYCRACRMRRPARAHHCSVCNRCVEHMDHHCPWVNNCIGRHNYRYFVSFLSWLALGCVYAAFVSFQPAYRSLTELQYNKLLALFSAPLLQHFHIAPLVYLQFAFCIAVSAGLAVSILLGWHLFLVLTAQTSVEIHINRSSRNRRLHGGKSISPYSRGSLHANWELVFGPCQFKLFGLLPSTAGPPPEPKFHGSSAYQGTAEFMV